MAREKFLKELQGFDLKIQALKRRKANLSQELEEDMLKENLGKVKKELSEKESLLEEEEKKQKRVEGELDLLILKIKQEDKKLYEGKITDPKELSDIQKEIVYLKRKKDERESRLLEQYELIEGIELEAKNFLQQIEEISKESQKKQAKEKETLTQIQKELLELEGKRKEIASQIPADVYALYDDLRKQKNGLGAVEIKEGVCQGCYVELPAEEADKMMETLKLWQCSNCQRILIR